MAHGGDGRTAADSGPNNNPVVAEQRCMVAEQRRMAAGQWLLMDGDGDDDR